MHIEMIRRPDAEGDDNRGFQFDLLEMRVDGERAGHLTMSHVPFHRLLSWYGADAGRTAVQWAARMRGMGSRAFLAGGTRLDPEPVLDDAQIARLWERMGRQCNIGNGPDLSWHVDRPLVDYIHVYGAGEQVSRRPGLRFRSSRPQESAVAQSDFLNRGLGLLLYVEGARWLGECSMMLHASGLQQPGAKRAWKSMERRFADAVLTIRARGGRDDEPGRRMVLDGRRLPAAWLPDGVSTLVRRTIAPGRPVHTNNIDDLEPPVRERFMEADAEAILAGRNPMGGEPMPATPREAIKAYGRQQALLAARLAERSREEDVGDCACGKAPCLADAPSFR